MTDTISETRAYTLIAVVLLGFFTLVGTTLVVTSYHDYRAYADCLAIAMPDGKTCEWQGRNMMVVEK